MSARTRRRIGRIIRRAPDPTDPAVHTAVLTELLRGPGRLSVRYIARLVCRDPGHDPSVIHKGGKR